MMMSAVNLVNAAAEIAYMAGRYQLGLDPRKSVFEVSEALKIENFQLKKLIMSPPDRVGRHIVFPRASVRPSVCLSVCMSVRHKSCPLYNSKTVKAFSMKLGTLVNHDETMCRA